LRCPSHGILIAVGSATMFPNLRLMLSASLAIIVLVAIVGSSLVLFRPPPARMADMPDIVRPVMAIADDGRPPLRVDASARRSSELQRLLTLPSGPSRAYAAEPPAAFPYEVTVVAAPAAPPSSPAQPASVEPQAPPATIVAALPEEPIREPEPMAAAEPPATVPDEVTTAATPEPVTVLSPPAEPETVAPQAMAPEPPPATVVDGGRRVGRGASDGESRPGPAGGYRRASGRHRDRSGLVDSRRRRCADPASQTPAGPRRSQFGYRKA
jgi:hypothetical protein